MHNKLKENLISIAKEKLKEADPSHDIYHALRVLKNAEYIAENEGGDKDIVIPSALFHDSICYPKNSKKSKYSTLESANYAAEVLEGIDEYPCEKIIKVRTSIEECSFSKNIIPSLLESKILQDADQLEATGAISIMRTFAYTGVINRKLYNYEDPFCEHRQPDSMEYALDLFYTRLLKIQDVMNTPTGRIIAMKRTKKLYDFLDSLKDELL